MKKGEDEVICSLFEIITPVNREIRVFSRDEKKQEDMRNRQKNPKVKFYLGNVRDYDSLLCG